jgi:hypothetical protein
VHVVVVNNAFLNAPLEEEIYLRQPEGADDGTGRVYRLNKALYGLKQAPMLWNEQLGQFLGEHGYDISHSDPSLFIQQRPDGSTFIPTWVDDLLLVGTTEARVREVKELLGNRYAIKDLGEVSTYLGMQIRRDRAAGWMELSLEKYVRGLAERYRQLLEGQGKVQTPMAPDIMHRLREDEEAWTADEAQSVPRQQYLSVVGSLMFAATAARPDLSFTASLLAQASADPRKIHMDAARRALRYLVDTVHYVLRFDRQKGAEVVGFTDSDWAGDASDCRSQAGFVFELAGGAVCWASKKLQGIATSSTVAEYKALSEGAKEATWLRQLLEELGEAPGPIALHCDNESALKLATKRCRLQQRTKHLRIAWHFVKVAVKDGEVQVKGVRTGQQDADMLMKALDVPKLKANRARVGMQPRTESTVGLSALLQGIIFG